MWRYMAKNGATEHSSKQTSLYETSLAVVTKAEFLTFQTFITLFLSFNPSNPNALTIDEHGSLNMLSHLIQLQH
ncbi:hypothetical protein V6N13_011718 [Hibiscus sabdariffa]